MMSIEVAIASVARAVWALPLLALIAGVAHAQNPASGAQDNKSHRQQNELSAPGRQLATPNFFSDEPVETEPSDGTLGTLSDIGLVTLGVSYLVPATIGLTYLALVFPFQYMIARTDPEPAMVALMLPVVGPFLGANSELLEGDQGWQALYIGIGITQAAGLVLWSLDLFDSEESTTVARSELTVRASAGGTPLGLTLSLTR